MIESEDPTFDVIYSLPVVAHSVAIANRTPTSGFGQKSKYMPDYGGVLETPISHLKNNAMGKGLPFKQKSSFSRISRKDNESKAILTSNDCLAVASYLESDDRRQFSAIRAVGKDLYFDSLKEIKEDDYTSIPYAHVPYADNILGIKRSITCSEEYIMVKFSQGLKIIKLDKSYQMSRRHEVYTDDTECDINIEQSNCTNALDFVGSVLERPTHYLKDASLSPFNQTMQAVASDNSEEHQVKLYDLSANPRIPIYSITWASHENHSSKITETSGMTLRRRTIPISRTFVPIKQASRGLQQIDHIPCHLVNMLATTDYQICMIDPRQSSRSHIYVDKTKIPSFYPIEFLRRTELSKWNSYQFYSLTNVHLRVFDTRYPGTPMNQVNHMLDSDSYDAMNLKLVGYDRTNLETLCVSSFGKLCFSTFDQTQTDNLVNPKSTHLPYHEPNLFELVSDENSEMMRGLDVRYEDAPIESDRKFSVIQLLNNGDIFIRGYLPPQKDNDGTIGEAGVAESVVRREQLRKLQNLGAGSSEVRLPRAKDRYFIEQTLEPKEVDFININGADLVSDIDGRKFKSKRASERFEKMKNKLDRT